MLTKWDYAPGLWGEMARMSRDMERLFGSSRASGAAGVFPALNVYDTGETVVVRAEVPGIDPADLDINATVNALTIKGERKAEDAAEGASFHRRERGHGSFSRTISMPYDIDPSKVTAGYKLGVLEVTLPKAEEAKPRKIAIRS